MTKLFKLFIVRLLTISVICSNVQGESSKALYCWHCSSDTIGSEDFCSIEFKEQNIPTDFLKERNLSIVRICNSTINSEHERAVCRKTIEETNGKTITKRFCYYTNKSDPLDHCNSQPVFGENVKRTFCQDCLSDKCNGAFTNYIINCIPLIIVTIITLSITKLIII